MVLPVLHVQEHQGIRRYLSHLGNLEHLSTPGNLLGQEDHVQVLPVGLDKRI